MAQQLKMFATDPGTMWWEEKSDFCKMSSSFHIVVAASVVTHTHTQLINTIGK